MNADAATPAPPEFDSPHPGLALLPPNVVDALGRLEDSLCRRTEDYSTLEPHVLERRIKADIGHFTRLCSIYKTFREALRLNPAFGPLPDPARFLPAQLGRALLRTEHAFLGLLRSWDNLRHRPSEREFEDAFRDLCRIVAIRKSALDMNAVSPTTPDGFPGWDADRDRNIFDDQDPPIPPPGAPPIPSVEDRLRAALDTPPVKIDPGKPAPKPEAGSGSESRPDPDSQPPSAASSSSFSNLKFEISNSAPSTSSTPDNAPSPEAAPPSPVPASSFSNLKFQISNSTSSVPSAPSPSSHPSHSSATTLRPVLPSVPTARFFPRIRTIPALSALAAWLLRLLRRGGQALLFRRPYYKNLPVFRFNVCVEKFIFYFDPTLAEDPEPEDPDLFPDDPGPWHAAFHPPPRPAS